LNYFIGEKFNHTIVSSHVKSVFGKKEYKKVLVVWDVKEREAVENEAKKHGVEIWYMREILKELALNIRGKGYRDDILRVIELMGKEEREKPL
jgi:hypothetical protein